MDGVRGYIEREVSADGSRSSIQWVCSSNQVSCDSDYVWSLPHHEKDRAGCHVSNKFLEERLAAVN